MLVDQVGKELLLIFFAHRLGTDGQEAGGDDVVRPLRVISDGEQISGELFLDEAVKWLVGIERVNHVVAVPPGVLEHVVVVATSRLGEPGHIEPVSPPAFPVLRRSQELIDEFSNRLLPIGRGRGAFDAFAPATQIFRRRRQPSDDQVQSPDEHLRGGIRHRRQPIFGELVTDKLVDCRLCPAGVRGGRMLNRPAVGPVVAARRDVDCRLYVLFKPGDARIWSAHQNPLADVGNRGLG